MYLNERNHCLQALYHHNNFNFQFFCPDFFIIPNPSKEIIKQYLSFMVPIILLTIAVAPCLDSWIRNQICYTFFTI